MDEPEEIAEAQRAPDAERPLESWIGAQVRGLRTALGMTLSDLAKAASISAGMLSKIEKGQTSPSLGTLQGLARSDRPAFSFQGHPEASPGPHDIAHLFDRFVNLMETR